LIFEGEIDRGRLYILKNEEDEWKREKLLKFTLLVARAFEVVEVLEGELLEDGADGLGSLSSS